MPISKCLKKWKVGSRWGRQGRCYVGKGGRRKALAQARAIYASKYVKNAKNPLKVDPTRTATIRRLFLAAVDYRFNRLKKLITKLVVEEDAFGLSIKNPIDPFSTRNYGLPTVNQPFQRWRFLTSPQKVEAFRQWIEEQVKAGILTDERTYADDWWRPYILDAYRKGQGRSFEDVRKAPTNKSLDFYEGTREEFLSSAFNNPISQEKIQLLAGRVLTDLKGVSVAMETQMIRSLADGMAQGKGLREISKDLHKAVDSIGKNRARTIARTEVIRAHADGQLDALERLGVKELGVMVEWTITEDHRVCELCYPLQKVVLKLEEARGLIPRHPNCRCAWIPANVAEDTKAQVRKAKEIQKAFDKSIEEEIPESKRKVRSLEDQKQKSRWPGADILPEEVRPTPILPTILPSTPLSATPSKLPPASEGKSNKERYGVDIPPGTPFEDALKLVMEDPEIHAIWEKVKELKSVSDLKERKRDLSNAYAKAEAKLTKLENLSKGGGGSRKVDLLRKEVANLLKEIEKIDDELRLIRGYHTYESASILRILELPENRRLQWKAKFGKKEETKVAGVIDGYFLNRNSVDEFVNWINRIVDNRGFRGELRAEKKVFFLRLGERCFYEPSTDAIYTDGFINSTLHEFCHSLEKKLPYIQQRANQFLRYRIAKSGKEDIWFKKEFTDHNFLDHEKGNPDAFEKLFLQLGDSPQSAKLSAAYVGKSYSSQATELLSMGVPILFEKPSIFAKADPEYFKYLVALLRGKL